MRDFSLFYTFLHFTGLFFLMGFQPLALLVFQTVVVVDVWLGNDGATLFRFLSTSFHLSDQPGMPMFSHLRFFFFLSRMF